MSPRQPLSHDTFWDDVEVDTQWRMKTRAYGERARAVVEMGFVRNNFWHPWKEVVDVDIDFDIRIYDNHAAHLVVLDDEPYFRNLRNLLSSREFVPSDRTTFEPNRDKRDKRIIVVKDMHPRVLELLGSVLDIPPEFFLAHCEDFATLSVMGRHCSSDRGLTYWKVLVPRSYDIPDEHLDTIWGGATYDTKLGNLVRGYAENPSTPVVCASVASYWASCYGADSWIALLLIDSNHCSLQQISNPQIRYHLIDFTKNRDLTRVFRHGRTLDSTTSQNRQPTFDMLLNGYEQSDLTQDVDLHIATAFIRNMIRSIWEEEILRIAAEVSDVQFEDEWRYLKPTPMATRAPDYERYRGLMHHRQRIQFNKVGLQHIMWSFRCRQRTGAPEPAEHESWAILEEKLDAADTILGDHMAMFAQRSALMQADAADRQARSSGQLTKTATFIVPGTFVASIFSMGGDFAAGERLFFVYWTLSIPVTILLLMWVMFNDPDRDRYFERLKRRMTRFSQGSNQDEASSQSVIEDNVGQNWMRRKLRQRKQHRQDVGPC